MSVTLISNRSQIVANAKAYETLVTKEVYRLPKELKKTALETITRTQAWIAVRDTNDSDEDVWLPVPQKWAGVVGVDIRVYEANRQGGIDVQRVGNVINRLGCYQAPRNHPAWPYLRNYAHNLGLELRDGATLWVIEGEDLPIVERVTLDLVTALASVSQLSSKAREVLLKRLVA
jgi:hypothetical protein